MDSGATASQNERHAGAATPAHLTTRVTSERITHMELSAFGNAAITFVPERAAQPPKSETTGNVTLRTEAHPGTPAYFEATYIISGHLERDGIRLHSNLHISVPVTGHPADAPYRSVELEAAARLPDALRSLADAVEKELAATPQTDGTPP